jgi:hypothetical protein
MKHVKRISRPSYADDDWWSYLLAGLVGCGICSTFGKIKVPTTDP